MIRIKFQIVIEVTDLDELVQTVGVLKGAGAVATVTEQLPVKSAETVHEIKGSKQESDDVPDPWAEDEADEPSDDSAVSPGNAATACVVKTEDRFGNRWTLNLPEAPKCNCGIPAGKVLAKAKGSGKPYSAWRCTKQLGDQWRDKCSYSELIK